MLSNTINDRMSHYCINDDVKCFTNDEGQMVLFTEKHETKVNFCPLCGREADEAGDEHHRRHEAPINLHDLVVEHNPEKTDCTKFLLCIQDGEIRSYDGCHSEAQEVAHAQTLIGTLPSGGDDDRRVMLSIDEVPEDEEGMSDDEKETMLFIERCSDSMMWYSDKVGETVPLAREETGCYWSREDAGYLNRVEKEDARIVEVELQ